MITKRGVIIMTQTQKRQANLAWQRDRLKELNRELKKVAKADQKLVYQMEQYMINKQKKEIK